MSNECELYVQLRSQPEILEAVAQSSPNERTSQKKLRERFPERLVIAAIQIQEARERARSRFPFAEQLWFNRIGLEQATAWEVAKHKAHRFSDCAVISDICCGIGSDASALSRHAEVRALDHSALMLCCTRWNAQVLGSSQNIFTKETDVTTHSWKQLFVHADPDRRSGRERPVRRLEDYQPGLDWMKHLIKTARGGALKVGPASNFVDKFPGCEIELMSLAGECREATIWFGELATHHRARATNISTGETFAADPIDHGVMLRNTVDQYLCDPDPGIVRSGLLMALAMQHDMHRLDAEEEYLTSSHIPNTTLVSVFRVEEVLSSSIKALRQLFLKRSPQSYELKCRRMKVDIEGIRKQLPVGEEPPVTIIFCRMGHRRRAIICRRVVCAS